MKQSNMPVIEVYQADVDIVRDLMLKAGTKMGSVHFIKRSTGELRKMSYRLGVTNPTNVDGPSGKGNKISDPTVMTVFDTNKVNYDVFGNSIGRGAYRTVALDGVKQISAGGKRYVIKSWKNKAVVMQPNSNGDVTPVTTWGGTSTKDSTPVKQWTKQWLNNVPDKYDDKAKVAITPLSSENKKIMKDYWAGIIDDYAEIDGNKAKVTLTNKDVEDIIFGLFGVIKDALKNK